MVDWKVSTVVAPFTPNLHTRSDDLVHGSFDGQSNLTLNSDTSFQWFEDAVAGGWYLQIQSDDQPQCVYGEPFSGPQQTVYGFVVYNDFFPITLCSWVLPSPVLMGLARSAIPVPGGVLSFASFFLR